jgi:hypothetical protein
LNGAGGPAVLEDSDFGMELHLDWLTVNGCGSSPRKTAPEDYDISASSPADPQDD